MPPTFVSRTSPPSVLAAASGEAAIHGDSSRRGTATPSTRFDSKRFRHFPIANTVLLVIDSQALSEGG